MTAPKELPVKALRIRVNIHLSQKFLWGGGGAVVVTHAQIAPLFEFLAKFTEARKFTVVLFGSTITLQGIGNAMQGPYQAKIAEIERVLPLHQRLQRMSVARIKVRRQNVAGGVAVTPTNAEEFARRNAIALDRPMNLTRQKLAYKELEKQLEGAVARAMEIYISKHHSTHLRFRTHKTDPYLCLRATCGRLKEGTFRKKTVEMGMETVKTSTMTKAKANDMLTISAMEHKRVKKEQEPVYRAPADRLLQIICWK